MLTDADVCCCGRLRMQNARLRQSLQEATELSRRIAQDVKHAQQIYGALDVESENRNAGETLTHADVC
jgi:hypothetical protein